MEVEEVLELTDLQKAAYREALQAHARKGTEGSFLALFSELRSLCDLDLKSHSSAKLDRICELMDEIAEVGEKAVVFSYILPPLHELSRRLTELQRDHTILTGEMPLAERERALARFKADPGCTALLASSRVAAEGLTLVEANHVIFINRWWNPSANAQARDRVVRIGQTRTVWIWAFVSRDTVETRLGDILKAKERTFDELVEAIGRSQVSDIGMLFDEP
jgi:non-specific serine/threonine protein kinase